MKKALSLVLAFVMVVGVFCTVPIAQLPFAVTASAADSEALGFKYCADGKSYEVYCANDEVLSGEAVIPSTYNGLPVTRIADSAFNSCSGLTSVTIPDSVTTIGDWAFEYCTGLMSVTIPNSVTVIGDGAFYHCTGLTSIAIPNSVTAIADSAFNGCARLTSVTIPDSVTAIGDWAFEYCTGLMSVTIPNSVTVIGDSVFEECTGLTSVTIPDSVTSIGPYAFRRCTGLTTITIPESVTSIYNGTFYNCIGLKSITISNSVTSIGENAFYNCEKLTSVIIPNSVTNIGSSAFSYCEKLQSVTIPESVTVIESRTFASCKNLKSIIIPKSVTEIGSSAFAYCGKLNSITVLGKLNEIGENVFLKTGYYNDLSNWENDVLYLGDYLIVAKNTLSGSYTVKNSTKTIAYKAFANCKEITSVSFPDSVTNIGGYAFYACNKLVSVSLPQNLKNISNGLFDGCKNLKAITIPNSVTGIGKSAFDDTGYYNTKKNWENGVLYLGNYLIAVDEDSVPATYIVKDGTTTIADKVFYGNDSYKVTTIKIPKSVKNIGEKSLGYYDCLKWDDEEYMAATKIPGFKIYGIAGSAAQKYADDNGFTFKTVEKKPSDTKLSGIANASTGIKISWNKASGADYYIVYRKSGESGYKIIKTGVTSTSYIDTTVKNGTKYTYTVRGYNIAGKGGCDLTGKTITYIAMPKLSSVKNEKGIVTLKWNSVPNVKGYYVYRKTANGNWSRIGNVKSTSYTDKTAKTGTTYTYTVKAYNGGTVSAHDAKGLSFTYLAIPKLKSVALAKGSGLTVKWNKVPGASGYYVYRKNGKGSWERIATVASTSYTDSCVLISGTVCTYTVRAYNGKSVSYYDTKGVSGTYVATPYLLSVSSSKSGVTLKWYPLEGVNGYYVYRKTGNGSWERIATVKGNSNATYLDKTAKKGTVYTYTVRAYVGKTGSLYDSKGLTVKHKY